MLGVINASNINNVNNYKIQIPFISYPTYLCTYTSVRLASCIVYILRRTGVLQAKFCTYL